MSTIWADQPFSDVISTQASRAGHQLVGPEVSRLAEASAVIVGSAQWDASMMDRVPFVRVIARTGVGVDSVDLEEAARRGIAVTNTPTGPTVSTAEHAVALMFSVAKTIPQHQNRLRQQAGNYGDLSSAIELSGKTLGLLGFGRIASRVATIASATGMSVITHTRSGTSATSDDGVCAEWVSFADLLRRSDVLSLHTPLTPATEGLFDATAFSACKAGMIFINCARGGIVDHDALVEALEAGHISAAGLDVTDPEPLPGDHPLLAAENVIVTPHVASSTMEGQERMLMQALEQATIALDGTTPSNTVNGVQISHRGE